MSGDFVALLQGQITTSTTVDAPLTIPTNAQLTAAGLPAGQAIAIRLLSSTGAVWKIGSAADVPSKTVTSGYYANGNIYAEANAIETFMLTGDGMTSNPTTIHTLADTTVGVMRIAFGYYKKT